MASGCGAGGGGGTSPVLVRRLDIFPQEDSLFLFLLENSALGRSARSRSDSRLFIVLIMPEYFDIYDEHGNLTGEVVERGEVHRCVATVRSAFGPNVE